MRERRLENDAHARSVLVCHPRRQERQGAVGLPDGQIRLASVVVHPDDGYPLATARVKWIADDHIIVLTMGSVLRVRPGLEKVIWVRPSDTR